MNETQLQKISSYLHIKIDKAEEPPRDDDGVVETQSRRNSEPDEVNDQVEALKDAMQQD